jgi:hypothetical protein
MNYGIYFFHFHDSKGHKKAFFGGGESESFVSLGSLISRITKKKFDNLLPPKGTTKNINDPQITVRKANQFTVRTIAAREYNMQQSTNNHAFRLLDRIKSRYIVIH